MQRAEKSFYHLSIIYHISSWVSPVPVHPSRFHLGGWESYSYLNCQMESVNRFLIPCLCSRQQRDELLRLCFMSKLLYTPLWSVRPSVGWSVTLNFFFYSWTSLLLPKWSGDLKYGPCPPARDLGSRVSGLFSLLTLRKFLHKEGLRQSTYSWNFSLTSHIMLCVFWPL